VEKAITEIKQMQQIACSHRMSMIEYNSNVRKGSGDFLSVILLALGA
jgi:hypothetical protein